MRILYFAWVRQKIGRDAEELNAPPATVAALLDALRARGGGYAEALGDGAAIRVAVNQDFVELDHPIKPDDEVAIFPPVTGG